jgi:8-oxo-dGTP diphosphatase
MSGEAPGMQRVAAGVLVEDGCVLIARRRDDRREGLKWEFPGGKLEPGETPEVCLIRELNEELGIQTQVVAPLLVTRHTYTWGTIELVALCVERLTGQPTPHDHTELRWVPLAGLDAYDFAAADLPIVRALCR